VVDVPRWLPVLYLGFRLAPGLFRRLMRFGGAAQRDYGLAEWRYAPKERER
jgi:hypothetical protein